MEPLKQGPVEKQAEPVQQRPEIADQSLDTSTKAPVVANRQDSNLKLIVVIVVAVLVALALIGLGYMAFIKKSEESAQNIKDVPASQADQNNQDNTELEATNIDEEMTEIDTLVSELGDDSDITEDEFSDTNLGL